jgi:hypothetical protein
VPKKRGHLMLFDYTLDQPALVQTIDLGTSYAFSVDFAPNSSQVVIGCSTGKLKAFNLPAGTEAWSHHGPHQLGDRAGLCF